MFSWRLLRALYAPDSYALVLLLILATYALSAALTASWATSLTVAVQIAAVWVTLRAARARRTALAFANIALGVAAAAAVLRRPGPGHVLPGPVLLVHHPHHHRVRGPDPGRQPWPVLRGA